MQRRSKRIVKEREEIKMNQDIKIFYDCIIGINKFFISINSLIKLNARSFQFIVQIMLTKLQFFIQYRKFPITVDPSLCVTGLKIEVKNFNFDV